jgi:serine/threonine protein kinase
MIVDPNWESLLVAIEGQTEIAGRFLNPRRIGINGGGGAFSLLFEAVDRQQDGTKVALKFGHPFESVAYRRECFDRESEILKILVGQKHIVQLVAPKAEFSYNAGAFNIPFRFYALELAETDLGSLIEAKALNARAVLGYFGAMCKAVRRLHKLEIAHRDIKPSNFLIMSDGTIKLSDFGTARLLNGAMPGILADYAQFPPGDLGYVAPEMLASLHDDNPSIALGADIFSLGSSFFEMFADVPLGVQLFDESFQQDLMQAMGAVRRGQRIRTYDQFVMSIVNSHPLPSIAAFSPDVPKCIVHQLDDLYRSMAAINYRHRLTDFEHIFLKIDRCIKTLENQENIRKWRERRDREHSARMKKLEEKRLLSRGIRSSK